MRNPFPITLGSVDIRRRIFGLRGMMGAEKNKKEKINKIPNNTNFSFPEKQYFKRKKKESSISTFEPEGTYVSGPSGFGSKPIRHSSADPPHKPVKNLFLI